MYCYVTFTKSPYLDNNLIIIKHSYFILLRFHDIGPLGQSQGGGARGQNLELPEICFTFHFKIETIQEDGWSFIV